MTGNACERRDLLRWIAFGLGAGALGGAGSGLLSACRGPADHLTRIQERGSVTLGIADEKPYGYLADGRVTGEAPEVARAVFAELGVTDVRAEPVGFSALIPALLNEAFDLIAAGMFVTPDRCELILFSEPDYCAQTAFLVHRTGPAADIATFGDVAADPAIRLGTLSTRAVEYEYARQTGVGSNQFVPVDDVEDGYDALVERRIDAFTLTRPSLAALLADRPNRDLEITEPFSPVIDGEEQMGCGGFGFRTESEGLRDAFNRELHGLRARGGIYPIVREFGFTSQEVAAARDVTVESLCEGVLP